MDYLFAVPPMLVDMQKLFVCVYYKTPVRLADTLSRLSHHVLLLSALSCRLDYHQFSSLSYHEPGNVQILSTQPESHYTNYKKLDWE